MYKSLFVIHVWLNWSVMNRRILIGVFSGLNFAIWTSQGRTTHKLISVIHCLK